MRNGRGTSSKMITVMNASDEERMKPVEDR
jgi:hypothetical protein